MAKKIYTYNAICDIRKKFQKLPNFIEQSIYEGKINYLSKPTMIFSADGYKTYVCKFYAYRDFEGEVVPTYTVRMYDKTPKKYEVGLC